MYSIENKERYEIYCRKQWHEIQDYQDIIHGERPILRCEDTYHLEFICENFKDVLRYFANHYYSLYNQDFLFKPSTMYEGLSYICCCVVVDQFDRMIYPGSYKYEIQKLIEFNDLKYQGNIWTPKTLWKTKKKQKAPSYVFRQDPVPKTGYWKRFFKNSWIRSTKFYEDTMDMDGVEEELEEMNIDLYLPRQKKKEKKPWKTYSYTWRHCDRSWKTSTKVKKQWIKNSPLTNK